LKDDLIWDELHPQMSVAEMMQATKKQRCLPIPVCFLPISAVMIVDRYDV
jgi:hypothetical protein